MFPNWYYSPSGNTAQMLQGAGTTSSGPTQASTLQGTANVQPAGGADLQPAINPTNAVDPEITTPLGVTTSVAVDPAEAAAAAKAAADAARSAQLRGEITNIANTIKDIFNSRYSQVESSGQEQATKLNTRFDKESKDITTQVEGENQKIGAASAAAGTYDSSYRGNNVDTVTKAGESQIADLGTELRDNLNAIASWVKSQQTGFDAQKSGLDLVVSRLGESTDPAELMQIRNSLDSRIAELQGSSADNNTAAQNAGTLEKIAPSSVRAQQLKTTLSQVMAGSADAGTKAAIGKQLIANANLTPQEQEELLTTFNSDISKLQPQS